MRMCLGSVVIPMSRDLSSKLFYLERTKRHKKTPLVCRIVSGMVSTASGDRAPQSSNDSVQQI